MLTFATLPRNREEKVYQKDCIDDQQFAQKLLPILKVIEYDSEAGLFLKDLHFYKTILNLCFIAVVSHNNGSEKISRES